jgi:hypothetical protein
MPGLFVTHWRRACAARVYVEHKLTADTRYSLDRSQYCDSHNVIYATADDSNAGRSPVRASGAHSLFASIDREQAAQV